MRKDRAYIQELRNRFVTIGKLIFDNGLTIGSGGQISARVEGTDMIMIKPTGYCLGRLKPEEIPMIKAASKRGLGVANLDEIEVIGEEIESVKCKFNPPPTYLPGVISFFWRTIASRVVRPKQYVVEEKCKACGVCKDTCPVDAIKVEDLPIFDFKKCIRQILNVLNPVENIGDDNYDKIMVSVEEMEI